MRKPRPGSIRRCALPAIPEYPGVQDTQLSLSYSGRPVCSPLSWDLGRREKSFSAGLSSCPRAASSARSLGGSSSCSMGCQAPRGGFRDKPLQEYFDERLMELRNYESRRVSRKPRGFAGEKQTPLRTRAGCRRRSSCSAVTPTGHGKKTEAPCKPGPQSNKAVLECNGQEETQKVLALYKSDCLDTFTMHITAPLEAFLQKKELQ